MKKALLAAAAAGLMAAAPAGAAVFSFSFITPDFNLLTTGTLTTSDASTTSPLTVTGISGYAGGTAITALDNGASDGADNLLYTAAGASHVDSQGISFDVGNIVYDVFLGASGTNFLWNVTSNTAVTGTFGIMPLSATSSVTEPATWAMLVLGFALAGVALRSRAVRRDMIAAV